MSATKYLKAAALVGLFAMPLSAQSGTGMDPVGTVRDRIENARRRTEAARRRTEAARSRTAGDTIAQRRGRGSSKVPPGHLPPAGKCRVWIDGVPPGQQPPVTDCATAEASRTANSRVIYGDRESFPGKGKGKLKGDRVRDDRLGDDDDLDEARVSKSERKAAKSERKVNKGKGGHGKP
jgi:hypothetical protein